MKEKSKKDKYVFDTCTKKLSNKRQYSHLKTLNKLLTEDKKNYDELIPNKKIKINGINPLNLVVV